MSQQAVRDTIINSAKARLALLSGAGKNVAWPNVNFSPPKGIWFSVFYLPTPPEPVTLGDEGEDELRAILQIDVNVPPNSGEAAQMQAIAALEAYYVAGRRVLHEGQSALVHKCSRSTGRMVDSDWRVSLSIYFSARYQRPVLS